MSNQMKKEKKIKLIQAVVGLILILVVILLGVIYVRKFTAKVCTMEDCYESVIPKQQTKFEIVSEKIERWKEDNNKRADNGNEIVKFDEMMSELLGEGIITEEEIDRNTKKLQLKINR